MSVTSALYLTRGKQTLDCTTAAWTTGDFFWEFGKGFVLGHLEENIYSVAFLHLFHSPTSSKNSTRLDGFQLNTTCVWDGWILKTIIWCSAQNPLLCRLRWSKKTVNFPVVYWPEPSVKGGPQEGRITTVTSAQKNKAAVWNQDHVLTRTLSIVSLLVPEGRNLLSIHKYNEELEI